MDQITRAEAEAALQLWAGRIADDALARAEAMDPLIFAGVADEERELAQTAAYAGACLALEQLGQAPGVVNHERLLDYMKEKA